MHAGFTRSEQPSLQGGSRKRPVRREVVATLLVHAGSTSETMDVEVDSIRLEGRNYFTA